jgi:predicted transcriptional regulator
MKRNWPRISVRLHPDVLKRLDLLATKHDRYRPGRGRRTRAVTAAINEWIARHGLQG